MLPSLVAQEIREGLRQFLVTGFEPSNAGFRGLVGRFLEQPGSLDKGPYLSIGLPFRPGSGGRDFFAGLTTKHPPHRHQEAAWRRLTSGQPGGQPPASTLVATGTGSGKTECFLYPILDHCQRERQAGRKGVKALVIYPMNALANDQARRFAETIHDNPALRGAAGWALRGPGLGGATGAEGMGPHSVISAKAALRAEPPDILLTNYKMLDYLLIRPRDRVLWRDNGPQTLRYLVVDELHTFDGAQGTDLALLIRRLKARLGDPGESSGVCRYLGDPGRHGPGRGASGLCPGGLRRALRRPPRPWGGDRRGASADGGIPRRVADRAPARPGRRPGGGPGPAPLSDHGRGHRGLAPVVLSGDRA